MKITVEQPKPQKSEKPFPKLMIGKSGAIVLMTSPIGGSGHGTVLRSEKYPHEVGKHFKEWALDGFTDFHGTITIDCTGDE